MKFYVASRFENKKKAKELIDELIGLGHQVTHDWTIHEKKDYKNNPGIAKDYSRLDIDGVRQADIFVALLDEKGGGNGMHTELGAAISSFLDNRKPEVYLLGDEFESMFFYHPAVKRIKDIKEIFA